MMISLKKLIIQFFSDKEVLLITIRCKTGQSDEIVESLRVLKNYKIIKLMEVEDLEQPIITYETKIYANKFRWIIVICLMYFFVYMLDQLKIM